MSDRKTVLLVEDDEDNRIVFHTMLDHVGYHVIEAHDGVEGVRRARADSPDLILMDVSLPRINGWEATRRIRSDDTTRDIPIVAISARALDRDRRTAREVGCNGYLTKPVPPHRVAQEVERIIGAPE